MQQQAAAAMAQQQGVFPPRMPAQFTNPLHEQQLQQQHQQQPHVHHQQQANPGQMNFRPAGPSDGIHPMQPEAMHGGGNGGGPPVSSDTRGGNKQDGPEVGSTGDGQGNLGGGAGRDSEGEP